MKLCITGAGMPFLKKDKYMDRITVAVDASDYAAIDRLARAGDVFASWETCRSMRKLDQRSRSKSGPASGTREREAG